MIPPTLLSGELEGPSGRDTEDDRHRGAAGELTNRRVWTSAAELTAIATLGLAIALFTLPAESDGTVFRVYALVVAAVALVALARVLSHAFPVIGVDDFGHVTDLLGRMRRRWWKGGRRTEQSQVDDLRRMEGWVLFATSSAGDFHYRLRPLLRSLAAERLLARHGVDLDRQPEAARGLLGHQTWEAIRVDRPQPEDRQEPGLDLQTIRGMVESLEKI